MVKWEARVPHRGFLQLRPTGVIDVGSDCNIFPHPALRKPVLCSGCEGRRVGCRTMDDPRSAFRTISVVRPHWPVVAIFVAFLALMALGAGAAADIADAQGMIRAGKYAAAIEESANG